MDDDTTAQPATAVDTHLEHPELTPSHTAHQHFHHDLKPVSLTSTSSTTGVEVEVEVDVEAEVEVAAHLRGAHVGEQATHSDIYQQSASTLQEVEELECQETVAEVTTTTASLETYQLGDAVDARTEQTLSHSENPTNTLPENTIEPTPYHPIDETLVIDEVNDIEPLVSEPDLQAQQRRASRIIEFERLIATIEPTDPALAEEEGADDNADADISIPLSTSTSFTTMDDDLPPSFLPHTEEEEEDDDELYIIDRAEAMEGDEVLFSADDATSPTSDPHDFFFNDRDRKHMSFSSTYSYIPFSPSDLATPATSFDLNSSETQREGRGRLDAANIHGTKDVFTETQKIAYVGLCCVTSLEIVHELEGKEASYARMSSDNWQRKLMRKLYRHMEVTKDEQTMIESLAKHDILPTDLVESFVSQGTTTTIPVQSLGEDLAATATTVKSITLAPDSDPSTDSAEERTSKELPPIPASPASTSSEQLPSLPTDSDLDPNLRDVEFEQQGEMLGSFGDDAPRSPAVQDESEETTVTLFAAPIPPPIPHHSPDPSPPSPSPSPSSPSLAGSVHDESPATTPASDALDPTAATTPLIIDLRWTVVCDLFLLCIAESNYDARSRVFLAKVAGYLWLEWHDVVAFERKVTEQLRDGNVGLGDDFSMSEEGDSVKSETERVGRNKQQQARRYLMIGLATLGGGLVLGLSAGLMAPVIGAGFGAILTTVGVSGTTAFLGGGGGIALITTGATVAGGGIAAKKMGNRTRGVETFEFIPMQDNERVSCIISVTGWLSKADDKEEAGYAFSTIDPIMGDHHALFWEPELLVQLGSAFKIIMSEAIGQAVQTALAHTVAGVLMAGLNFPMAISKLSYLIDNPWANALDRSRLAGLILADTLMNRKLGVRPITLIGFSLGARVIFYCLLELARVHAFGVVENVFIFGTPVIANQQQWREACCVVSGRFVNGYARSDWLLGFLFRASSAGLGNIAGLRPIKDVPRIDNVDCTDMIKGHLHYRNAMPKILAKVGVKVTSEVLQDKGDTAGEKGSRSSVMGLVGFGRNSSSLSLDMVRKSIKNASPRSSVISLPSTDTEGWTIRGVSVASDQDASATVGMSTSPSARTGTSLSSFSSGHASISLLARSPTPGSDGESSRPATPPVGASSPRKGSASWFNRNRKASMSSSLPLSPSTPPLTPSTPQDQDDDGLRSGIMTPTTGYFDDLATRRPSAHAMELDGAAAAEEPAAVTTLVVKEEPQRGAVELDEILALATAAAVSSTGKNIPRSSLSTGKASIALTGTSLSRSPSPSPIMMAATVESEEEKEEKVEEQPTSPTSSRAGSKNGTSNRSSISGFFTNPFARRRDRSSLGATVEDQGLGALEEAGIQVKEIKVTLPKMIIPNEVANPVPQVSLQAPPSVRRW